MVKQASSGNQPADRGPTPAVSEEMVFKVAKEVVVKFIEVGRLTPADFDETFQSVYASIKRTVLDK